LRVSCDSKGISKAVRIIENGGIVVFPTDTVYGIGCNPYDSHAVENIYKIKNRGNNKLFPILGYSIEELEKIAIFDNLTKKIIEKFWPGQLTLIVKLKDDKIKKSMKLDDKIAIRIPNNKCALSILKQCKILVGTSANISGESPLTDPNDCEKNVKGYDVLVDGGKISSTGESTIIECNKNGLKIHRQGIIPSEEIQKIL